MLDDKVGTRAPEVAHGKVVTITQENFESEILKSQTPVLVDLWAPWCGPCRMMAPVLDELATELDGKVRIAKLNVDDHQQLASQFGVRSIPMFLIFKDGKVADTAVGAMPKSQFQTFIQRNL